MCAGTSCAPSPMGTFQIEVDANGQSIGSRAGDTVAVERGGDVVPVEPSLVALHDDAQAAATSASRPIGAPRRNVRERRAPARDMPRGEYRERSLRHR